MKRLNNNDYRSLNESIQRMNEQEVLPWEGGCDSSGCWHVGDDGSLYYYSGPYDGWIIHRDGTATSPDGVFFPNWPKNPSGPGPVQPGDDDPPDFDPDDDPPDDDPPDDDPPDFDPDDDPPDFDPDDDPPDDDPPDDDPPPPTWTPDPPPPVDPQKWNPKQPTHIPPPQRDYY